MDIFREAVTAECSLPPKMGGARRRIHKTRRVKKVHRKTYKARRAVKRNRTRAGRR